MRAESKMYSKEQCEVFFEDYRRSKAKYDLDLLMIKAYDQTLNDFMNEDSDRARRGEAKFRKYREEIIQSIPVDKEKMDAALRMIPEMFVSSLKLWPEIFSEIEAVSIEKMTNLFFNWIQSEKFFAVIKYYESEYIEVTLQLVLADFVKQEKD